MTPERATAPRPAGGTHRAAAVALVVSMALLAGCGGSAGKITLNRGDSSDTVPEVSTGPDGTAPTTGSLTWGSCSKFDIAVTADVLSSARQSGLECAALDVPVDHAAPDGATTELALARLPATGSSSKRIGSLIVNPGGPGGSGLEFLASSGLAIPDDLRQRFDIVSFDPRGIASSSPLDCLTQTQRADLVDAESPDDPAQAQAQAADTERTIAEGCEADDAELFRNMGTDQVAGDLDDIREAVGDDELTFLGLSYGTRIAASYATQFPDKVRAVVLDGSVTPSRDLAESSGGQIKGIVRALDNFVQLCNADTTCAIAPDALGKLTAVADSLDATPMTIDGGDGEETLDKDKYLTGVVTALYDPSVSMALADAVAALLGTDSERAQEAGRFLLDLAGQQDSKQPDGTYGNGFETQGVVNCLDAADPLDAGELPLVREIAGPIPPLLDSDPATDTPSCTLLPTGDRLEIAANDAKDRLLIVGTEGDPATPIEWTRAMTAALGDPAVIVYGGSGHTASLSRKCVTSQVTEFFISGKVPPSLQDCPRDPAESDIYAQIGNQFETMGLGADIGTCIANALRGEIDPLGIISLNGDDPDPEVISKLQRAALSCR